MNIYEFAINKGYRIDDKGNVFSPSMRLNLMRDASGYLFFTIRVNGKCNKVMAHRLQAYIKYGDKMFEKGIVVRHLNGKSLDNSLENIAIGTQSDNMMDIPRELRIAHARKAGDVVRKYDHEAVYRHYMQTRSYKKTKEKFGITAKSTIHAIVSKFKANNAFIV
ncbi:MAG: HNH endonuclease [Alistipes sp.]|nr:HNH endonuclease [Alistipes sp.]